MKGFSSKLLTFVAIVVLILGITAAASAAPDTKPLMVQETCPSGGDWVKIEGLSGTSFTYTAPEGKVIVAWCYKASTFVESGVVDPPQTSYTVTSTVGHDLSHASFQLADAPPDPATVSVGIGACVWDGASLTPVTVTITGNATVTISGPGGPYVFTSSGSMNVEPGSYSWTAVAGSGYEISGPASGSFVAEACEPEDDPATVSVEVGACVWDDGQSLTFVSVTITGDATVTITGPGGPYTFTSSGSFDAAPGSYSWTALAGDGYYIDGPDSGSFEALSCAPDEASVQIAIGICVYEEGDSTTEVTVTINGVATVTITGPGGPYVFTSSGSFNGAPGSYLWTIVAGEGYVLVGESSGEFSLVSCEPGPTPTPVPTPTPTPKEPPTGAFDSPNLLPGLLILALGSALVLFGRRKKMI